MSITPNPPVQTVFEAIDEREDHDEKGNAPTYAPEIALSTE